MLGLSGTKCGLQTPYETTGSSAVAQLLGGLILRARLEQPSLNNQFSFENTNFNFGDVIILHERRWSQNRCRQTFAPNIFLYLPFALPMVDAGISFSSTYRRVDKMFDAGRRSGVRHILTLLNFPLC